jgi:hypothetical protein
MVLSVAGAGLAPVGRADEPHAALRDNRGGKLRVADLGVANGDIGINGSHQDTGMPTWGEGRNNALLRAQTLDSGNGRPQVAVTGDKNGGVISILRRPQLARSQC